MQSSKDLLTKAILEDNVDCMRTYVNKNNTRMSNIIYTTIKHGSINVFDYLIRMEFERVNNWQKIYDKIKNIKNKNKKKDFLTSLETIILSTGDKTFLEDDLDEITELIKNEN